MRAYLCICVCGTETAVEERGVLPELVRLDSFPDLWSLIFFGGGIAGMLWRLREATRRRNAASSDIILCYHAEFVVFCSDSQYRHLLVLIELVILMEMVACLQCIWCM